MEQTQTAKRKRKKTDRFEMITLEPKGDRQKAIFKAFDEGHDLLIHGTPGTGKTFITMGLALDEIIYSDSPYEKLIIVRSLVQSRDMGFLPGSQKEKIEAYEAAYMSIAAELFKRGDAYDILKNRGHLEFIATSFLRGLNFRNCIVLVDECQNMDEMELHTIITRVAENCRIMFIGDTNQDDLTNERRREKSGFPDFINILKELKNVYSFEMKLEDIQRSGLVREYLVAKLKKQLPF